MSNGQIFISYRRDDSAGYVRALYDRLIKHFPKKRVFVDVDAIDPGSPFDETINRALEQCEVMIVVIGKHWMKNQEGVNTRINDSTDYVHIEIAAALSRNILVVPVLIEGASIPSENELPEPLRALAKRNALEISNSRFDSDTEKLIKSIHKFLEKTEESADLGILRRKKPLLYWLAGGLAVVVLGTLIYLYSGLLMRPQINCEWEANVTYDWPNANYIEKFDFHGEGDEVLGTASHTKVKARIIEGRVRNRTLKFMTKTKVVLGGDNRDLREQVHHYRGEILGNEIKFVMETESPFSDHVPVHFIAKKVPNTCK